MPEVKEAEDCTRGGDTESVSPPCTYLHGQSSEELSLPPATTGLAVRELGPVPAFRCSHSGWCEPAVRPTWQGVLRAYAFPR